MYEELQWLEDDDYRIVWQNSSWQLDGATVHVLYREPLTRAEKISI